MSQIVCYFCAVAAWITLGRYGTRTRGSVSIFSKNVKQLIHFRGRFLARKQRTTNGHTTVCDLSSSAFLWPENGLVFRPESGLTPVVDVVGYCLERTNICLVVDPFSAMLLCGHSSACDDRQSMREHIHIVLVEGLQSRPCSAPVASQRDA